MRHRYEDDFSSFKVIVRKRFVQNVLKPDVWPEKTVLDYFKPTQRRRRDQYRNNDNYRGRDRDRDRDGTSERDRNQDDKDYDNVDRSRDRHYTGLTKGINMEVVIRN